MSDEKPIDEADIQQDSPAEADAEEPDRDGAEDENDGLAPTLGSVVNSVIRPQT